MTDPIASVCSANNEYPAGDVGLQNAVACAAEKIRSEGKSYFIKAWPGKKTVESGPFWKSFFGRFYSSSDLPHYYLYPQQESTNEVSLKVLIAGYFVFIVGEPHYHSELGIATVEAQRNESEKDLIQRLNAEALRQMKAGVNGEHLEELISPEVTTPKS